MHYAHDPDALRNKLKKNLAEAVMPYATVEETKRPLNYTVKARAMVDVLTKGD